MKHAILILAAWSFFSACQYVANSSDTAADSTQTGPVVVRDESINQSNAYSDLFLDSAALEQFIQKEKMSGNEASELRNFYYRRNFQFAWFNSTGITEQGRNFWSLQSGVMNPDSSGSKDGNHRLDTLVTQDSLSLSASDSSIVHIELGLTQQFVRYVQKQGGDSTKINLLSQIPVKKTDPMTLADSILNKNTDSASFAGNKAYVQMREQLRKYHEAAKQGGWQPITVSGKSLKKGSRAPEISAIKKRLYMTGDLHANDTTAVFSDSLEAAIKSYQQRNGFKPSGVINDSLVKVMNISAEQRMEQILVNMNRMAWMPQPEGAKYIVVNIPEYMLHAYDSGHRSFDMPIVVGKEGTTMTFSGKLNQVVFSPYWNVPKSIVRDEIAPAMKKDPNYLKKHNMEITGNKNDSFPEIRQLPGAENSLGKVKFLFPNSYDIYLHDTPHKDIFSKDKRAVSHGCIRLADAPKMAQFLLTGQQEWTPEKIKSAMNSGKEQSVKVANPVPVYLTYYTAWVDENGQLNFRNDVYRHDETTAGRMFMTGG